MLRLPVIAAPVQPFPESPLRQTEAAAAVNDMMAAENRLLERRRTWRRDEVKASIPATSTAGPIPYQPAIASTKASISVTVTFSCADFQPVGKRNVRGNRPTIIIKGI